MARALLLKQIVQARRHSSMEACAGARAVVVDFSTVLVNRQALLACPWMRAGWVYAWADTAWAAVGVILHASSEWMPQVPPAANRIIDTRSPERGCNPHPDRALFAFLLSTDLSLVVVLLVLVPKSGTLRTLCAAINLNRQRALDAPPLLLITSRLFVDVWSQRGFGQLRACIFVDARTLPGNAVWLRFQDYKNFEPLLVQCSYYESWYSTLSSSSGEYSTACSISPKVMGKVYDVQYQLR